MAGRGPAPKDPNKRARTNKDPVPLRVVTAPPSEQPALTEILGDVNPLTAAPWQRASLVLWEQMADFPTTANLQAAQWSSLARAMMIDDALVAGDAKMAAEARLRIAKYGIDPDDLTRLRVQIVAADEAEDKRPTAQSSRSRRSGGLKALPEAQ